MTEKITIYLLPPLLTLVVGLFLALLGLSTRKQILFSLVCIWYVLLAPLFLLHPFVDDEGMMLGIQRWVHFFYVYFPLIQILFTHDILRIRRSVSVWAASISSVMICLTVPTDFYLTGFNYFSWGYIVTGGIAFKLFSVYGFLTFVYCFFCFIHHIRRESNSQLRLKYIYLVFAFGLSSILTMLNMLAVSGIDVYPTSNFTFIPLSILAYGIFRHRMLEVRTILKLIGVGGLLAFLIMTPHYVVLKWLWPELKLLSSTLFFWIAAFWFIVLYFHGRLIFKLVWFAIFRDRQRFKAAKKWLQKMMLALGNADDLIEMVIQTITRTTVFPKATVYLFDAISQTLSGPDGKPTELKPELQRWLGQSLRIIELSVISLQGKNPDIPHYSKSLFFELHAEYLLPLVHDDALVGVLAMPGKANGRQITPDENRFFMEIARPFSLALSNAVMYQHVLNLKEHLQSRTKELTQEVSERRRVEADMTALQKELEKINLELERAILQANEMTSKAEVSNYVLAQEVEERKSIEEALRQSEERYRMIADNSTDVIWTLNMESRFTYISPSVKQLLGYTPEEMFTFDISKVLTPESLKIAGDAIMEELRREKSNHIEGPLYKTRSTELEHVCKSGDLIWTEANTRFIRDSEKNIVGILGVTRDISSRKKSEQDLIYMAYHDPLTGLYNRKAFYEQLDKDIKYSRRYGGGLALLLLDLNKFKTVNDTHGHHIGDLLLKAVSDRLRMVLRETDQIARLGGDEFTVILKTPDKIETQQVVNRINSELAAVYELNGLVLNDLSASIGMAIFPEDGADLDELVRSADTSMYEAKKKLAERASSAIDPGITLNR